MLYFLGHLASKHSRCVRIEREQIGTYYLSYKSKLLNGLYYDIPHDFIYPAFIEY